MRCFDLPFCLPLIALVSACQGDRGAQPDLFEAVGWLARDGRAGPCQGVAIATDRVLTAAHCVVDRASWQAPPPGDLEFVTAGRAFVVLEAEFSAKRSMDPSGAILDLQQDWAILRVATREGALRAPLPVSGHRTAWLAFSFGEPVVKAGLVRVDDGQEIRFAQCTISTLDGGRHLLTYHCGEGAGPGLSGSPLLAETGDGFELIGVMSAKERLPSGGEVGIAVIPPEEEVAAATGLE